MIGGVLVGTYEKGGHRYDIRLKLEESSESPRTKVKSLFVRNNRSELIPLSDLVSLEEKESMVSIWRSNRERSITIYANVKAGESQQKALLRPRTSPSASCPRLTTSPLPGAHRLSPNRSRASSGFFCWES